MKEENYYNYDKILSYNAMLNFLVGERRRTVKHTVLKNLLLINF